MIKPEEDLELSIKALEVYPIEPAIIKSMLSNLQKVVKQNCNLQSVSNWLAFDEIKPEADKLFLITNGSFVEIAYYENGEIQKPWKFDKYDIATLNAQQNGLKWQYIDLPSCC